MFGEVREGGLFTRMKVSVLHKQLERKMGRLEYIKLEVMQQKFERFDLPARE